MQSNGTTLSSMSSVNGLLTPIELQVLAACREVTVRQTELLPLLAEAIHVPKEEVFRTWVRRQCPQHGSMRASWTYFFHGLECDLENKADGRFIRMDFGPGGRVDTFSAWGVLQFIMTTSAPWSVFPHLKQYFGKKPPSVGRFSGSFEKMADVWAQLEAKGIFAVADQELVAFAARHTFQDDTGVTHVRFPPETSEEMIADCSVALRTRLSPYGLRLLQEAAQGVLPAALSA